MAKWLRRVATQYLNLILAHIMMMIVIVFYPQHVGAVHMGSESQYIPRSRLRKGWITGMTHDMGRWVCNWHRPNCIPQNKPSHGDNGLSKLMYEMQRRIYRGWDMCMQTIAMQASNSTATKGARTSRFDTDSVDIGVDNRCSGCISHKIDDFEGPLTDTNRVIKGFGGTKTHNVKVGTLRWKWQDDEGTNHEFRIPNSYYIPSGKVRLLSPQHWSKAICGNNRKNVDAAGETTVGNRTTLFWGSGRYKLTIPMCPRTNVATFQTTPGYQQCKLFCQ